MILGGKIICTMFKTYAFLLSVAYATIMSAKLHRMKTHAYPDLPEHSERNPGFRYHFQNYDQGKTPRTQSVVTQYRNLTIIKKNGQGDTKHTSPWHRKTTNIYWIKKMPGVYKKMSVVNRGTPYDYIKPNVIHPNSNGAIENLSASDMSEMSTSEVTERSISYTFGSSNVDSTSVTKSLEIMKGVNTAKTTNTSNHSDPTLINKENTQSATIMTYNNIAYCQYAHAENFTSDIIKPGDNEVIHQCNGTKISTNLRTDRSTERVTREHNYRKLSRRYDELTNANIKLNQSLHDNKIFDEFKLAVAKMEKQFYLTTFEMLLAKSPEERRESGISFVLSGAWLHALLLLLSGETDADARAQLDNITRFPKTLEEKDRMIKRFVTELPPPSESLKLTWFSRLVLGRGTTVSDQFRERSRNTLDLKIDTLMGDNVTQLVETLNDMVQRDTGGALRGTFDEADLGGAGGGGLRALLLSTLYFRSSWRAPVTLLNGTRDFRDGRAPPYRQTRMFRVNDLVGYARVPEWDAEVVEIPYATANLSLVAVVPRSAAAGGLRAAARAAAAEGARALTRRLRVRRAALTLPLFTLRMTLLLPTKLEAMGAPALVTPTAAVGAGAAGEAGGTGLRLSHGVQRLMFWADAGRNAYKDDGVEWDPRPDLSLVVDRPYFFMVKWNDFVLMMGNFVL